ncbi:hypothetical protein [Acinetobacter sp. YH1901134]|uniref:hypothetical protein n=1 Tax=Acinetobacter sp. YH1901134 TaxID=2601199 RepID=UPI0015D1F6DC|nr:hypothetical protein [Acinetobacter sp. YH1901134]
MNVRLTREKWSEEQTNLVAEFQQLLVDDPTAVSAFVVEHRLVLGALIQQEMCRCSALTHGCSMQTNTAV